MLKQSTFKLLNFIFFCLAIFTILCARHGYVFGSGDQSETLPIVLWLNNHTLYPFDFFIQKAIQHPFNERLFFAWFLKLFSQNLKYGVFFLYVFCTASLLFGIFVYTFEKFNLIDKREMSNDITEVIKNAFKVLTARYKIWVAILFPLLFLYNINTGSNELYDNSLNPSFVANTLCLWAFILYDYRKNYATIILITLATFFQPLIGALSALLFFVSEIALYTFIFRQKNWAEIKRLIWCAVIYFSSAGIYLFILSYQIGSTENPALTMQIIAMRAPHHYFPDQFSILGYVFMAACAFSIFRYGNHTDHILTFFIILGCIIYTVGVYFFGSNFILNTQFFRMTIWIKLWGSILMMCQVLTYLENNAPMLWARNNFKAIIFLAGIVSAIVILPQFRIFKHRDYMFPFLKNTNADVEISERAKISTPNDALFLTPPNLDAFRFYSARSNFIDFKAIFHENSFLKEWQKRMQLVYNVGTNNSEKGFKLVPVATNSYNALTDSTLMQLCAQNKISYIIRENNFPVHSGFTKIDSTLMYSIYRLQ